VARGHQRDRPIFSHPGRVILRVARVGLDALGVLREPSLVTRIRGGAGWP